MSIGSRIKEARKAKELTQEYLAYQVGVTKGAIANYENNVSVPKIEILYKLMEALQIDANYLYQDEMVKIKTHKTQMEYCEETSEVAAAYEKASIRDRNIIRQVLGLPLIDSD